MRETELDTTRPSRDNAHDNGIDDGLLSPDRPVVRDEPSSSDKPVARTPPGGYFPIPSDSKPRGRPLDINTYATKKTVAQGMMDIALLTANANQLRYVLEAGSMGGLYYYFNVTLISCSIILQLCIGVLLILIGRYNVARDSHAQRANKLNNFVVLGVFFITVINIFISAFGIEPMDGPAKFIQPEKYPDREEL